MKNGNSAMTSIRAAMIGAAVGAAAVALADKKTRVKLKSGINDFIEKSNKEIDSIKDKGIALKKKGQDTARKELKKTEKKLAAS